jgi:phenylacetate-CoA ligase
MFYERLFRGVLFPFYEDFVRRRGTYRYYREISSAPFMSREKIDATRDEKFARLIRYAAENVPFYRRSFDELGIDPADVRAIDGLREAGFVLTKDMLRAGGDALISREYDKAGLEHYETGGSTGMPVTIYMSSDQYARRDAGKYRVEDWVGKPPGTRTTIIWGRTFGAGWAKKLKRRLYWGLRNYQYLSAYDIEEENLLGYVERIRRHRSRFVEAYVSVLYEMARVMEAHAVEPPPLEGIITGAEVLYDFQRELIEKSFCCPVYNRYGSSEFKSIASQCEFRKGMHINEDSLIVEVVDDEGRPLVGEPGNIMVTDLENLAMPMIRYRIGDIGVLSDERCECGRNFRMLDRVIGRENDVLVLPDGSRKAGQFVAFKMVGVPGVLRYQVLQRSPDSLHIRLVETGEVERDTITEWLRRTYSDVAETGVELSIEFVDDIPRTGAGKMQFFVSMLGKETGDEG